MSLGILVALLLVGAAGFYLFDERGSVFQSVYLTALILTTVGMKQDGVDLNHAQQIWALGVMLVGISAALYAAGNVFAFIIDGELRRFFGSQQLQKKIDRLKDHYIICGFGRMGRALCGRLESKGAPFVLIENNPDHIEEANDMGYLCLQGDAMSEQVLKSSRIDRAKGLASCLKSDADNVFVTLTARGVNRNLLIITCAQEIDTEPKLRKAGADRVICPSVLTANRITHMLLQPDIDELLELTMVGPDMEISKVAIDHLPGAVGRSLRELSLPSETGVMVVAIVRAAGQRRFNPTPDEKLEEGDEMIVISQTGGVDTMMALFGRPE